jgi:hypothetical protein
MSINSRPFRVVALGAVGLGLAAGSYGIASAATGSGTGSATVATSTQTAAQTVTTAQQPWGGQRSDETLLTGDTATKVTQAALTKVPGGTIVRVETDADGHALYEAHMTKSDGTPVTVYVDKSFNVVSVDTRMPGPPGARQTA